MYMYICIHTYVLLLFLSLTCFIKLRSIVAHAVPGVTGLSLAPRKAQEPPAQQPFLSPWCFHKLRGIVDNLFLDRPGIQRVSGVAGP